MKLVICGALVTSVLASAAVEANDTQLLQPVGPAVVVENIPPNGGASLGIAGYYTGGPVYFSIEQWGIPHVLTAASGAASGWSIANADARVQYYPSIDGGTNVYELAQAGSASNCGVERDLFLASGDPTVNSSESLGLTKSAALSTLGSIQLNVGLHITFDSVTNSCGNNYGQYVHSLILTSTGGQVLFYQINLGKTVDPGHNNNVAWCPLYETSTNAQFCLDDDVRNNLNGAWVSPGLNIVNNFDFLPRLLQVIKAGHTKSTNVALDSDPSHWTISRTYSGSIVQGNDISTSRWYGLSVGTMSGGTFCDGTNTIQWSCTGTQPDGSGWVNVGSGCFHRNTLLACF